MVRREILQLLSCRIQLSLAELEREIGLKKDLLLIYVEQLANEGYIKRIDDIVVVLPKMWQADTARESA